MLFGRKEYNMDYMKLDIQLFSDGKVVIDTELNTKNFENGLSKMKSTSQKAGTTIKNIVAGLGIAKLVSVAMNQISASIDGAVARVDTLNNFPKVMSNLGIGAEEAQKAIDKMSDKLAGLPTTLDQGAMAVQRFASVNGNVAKSTDIFLALNNAILAGGASSEIQASALEQLSQAYAKGKPDMMEWRTAMMAMPAQLKQVSTAMGYVSTDQLGEALRSGEVSMDEFMAKITEMNEKGIAGFQSFEEQAKNSTGGIKTAITVAKTQVVKGVADIIEALNVRLSDLGLGSVSELIANIGKKAKEGLDIIAGLIAGELTVSDVVKKATDLVSKFIQTINQKLPTIIKTGMKMISDLIIGIAQALPTLIPQALETVMTIVNGLLDNLDLIIDAGIQLLLGLLNGIIEALPQLMDYVPVLIEKLITAILSNLPLIMSVGIQLIIALIEGLIKALPKIALATPKIINAIIKGLTAGATQFINSGMKVILNIISGIKNKLGNLGTTAGEIRTRIINKIKSLPSEMLSWGKDMIQGFINGIRSKINAVGDAAASVAKKVKNFLHFSKPDEGPLREYETWMPDMVKGLARTMEQSSNILANQAKELAEKIKENMYFDDVFDEMQQAIDLETAKMGANIEMSDANRTIQQAITASATLENTIPLQIDLDGEVIYDNQQKVSQRKALQYGSVK